MYLFQHSRQNYLRLQQYYTLCLISLLKHCFSVPTNDSHKSQARRTQYLVVPNDVPVRLSPIRPLVQHAIRVERISGLDED